ncbi:MAG: prepilin peptidase [Oligoflexia bacterium]|nr:prepilin peptidase [Oligoflexia bacterium]
MFDFTLILFLFVLGACFGSFGGVVVLRLMKGQSIISPKSFCQECNTAIAFYDNIPLISYLVLKGRCRKCAKPIGKKLFLIELLSALIFVSLFLKLGLTWNYVEAVVLSWGMLVISFIDFDHRIIPDVFTLPGILIGILGAWVNPDRTVVTSLMGFLAGGGVLWTVAFIYSAVKKEEGMGGGDIKLLAWIGAVMGWQAVIYTILVSSVLGSVVGILMGIRQKSSQGLLKTSIPFGPFLSLAAFSFFFMGEELIKKYLQFFFPFY